MTPQTAGRAAPKCIKTSPSSPADTGIADTVKRLFSLNVNSPTASQSAADAKEAEEEYHAYLHTLSVGQLCALAVAKVRADALSNAPEEPRTVPYPHTRCCWPSLVSRYRGAFVADPFAADRARRQKVVKIEEDVAPDEREPEVRYRVRRGAAGEERRIGEWVERRERALGRILCGSCEHERKDSRYRAS
jgi:hypothetical protein